MTNGLQTWFWEVGLANPRRGRRLSIFSPQDLRRFAVPAENRKPLPSIAINTGIVDRPYQHEAIRHRCRSFSRQQAPRAAGDGHRHRQDARYDGVDRSVPARESGAARPIPRRPRRAGRTGADRRFQGPPAERAARPHLHLHRYDQAPVRRHGANHGACVFSSSVLVFRPCRLRRGASFHLQPVHRGHRVFRRPHDRPHRHAGAFPRPRHLPRVRVRSYCPPSFTATSRRSRKGILVDFSLHQAQTGFQRKGIKGADLSEEERNALIEQGLDPDPIDYPAPISKSDQQPRHAAQAVGRNHGGVPQGPIGASFPARPSSSP